METVHFLCELSPDILAIILKEFDLGNLARLIRSSKSFNFLKKYLVNLVQTKINNNPKQFGFAIMWDYIIIRSKSLLLPNDSVFENGIKHIAKCDFPLSDSNFTNDTICDIFLSAIQTDDFDTLRILILLVSPRKVVVPCVSVKQEIRKKLLGIVGVRNRNFTFKYPLFFLQVFGASQNLINKTMELLEQIDQLPYLLWQEIRLGNSPIGYATNGTSNDIISLSKAVKKHSKDLSPKFLEFCKSNDQKYQTLYVQEKTVLGLIVPYISSDESTLSTS